MHGEDHLPIKTFDYEEFLMLDDLFSGPRAQDIGLFYHTSNLLFWCVNIIHLNDSFNALSCKENVPTV